jgi:drug/metabolite transporter (DMT)-like permease
MAGFAVYWLLVVVGVFGAIGDTALNLWARSNRSQWLLLSYFLWIGVATLFGFILRWHRYTFGAAVVLALLVHAVAALVIDKVYFGGRLSGWEWAGLACACAAIALIEIGRPAPRPESMAPCLRYGVPRRLPTEMAVHRTCATHLGQHAGPSRPQDWPHPAP